MLSNDQIKNRIECGRYSKNDIRNLLSDAQRRNNHTRIVMIKGLIDDDFNVINPNKNLILETTGKERRKILEQDYENEDIMVANKFLQIRQSALKRNLEFNISLVDVKRLLRKKRCHYSGRLFGEGQDIRTFDRVDDSLGYVKGNVVSCTKRFNDLKNELLEKPDGSLRCSKSELKKFVSKL